MAKNKQSKFCYRITQVAAWFVAKFVFGRKFLRNEIKGKKGPFVVIANHQASLDFVNLIGATKTPMSFVISNSFFNSLPITSFMKKVGVIPKQQFQTGLKDMNRMKSVIKEGKPLVIYPAGLMCEDGISTPIPTATYKFLKWLGADVYVAKTIGSYFVMPKWSKKIRQGKTYLDIYKLFDAQELVNLNEEEIKAKAESALVFDAYREQEEYLIAYKNGFNINGLENVLYSCPHCKSEFSTENVGDIVIKCKNCGFMQWADPFGFMHCKDEEKEIKYASDWSRAIFDDLKEKIINGEETTLSAKTEIHMIDYKKHKFIKVGNGEITLDSEKFLLKGIINEQEVNMEIPIVNFASLPFKPGKYIELQSGENIYRCVLEDGKLAMKFINMVKIFYKLKNEDKIKA